MTAGAATSDPRATNAAVEILRSGGNAVDAAAAAAFVLYVVEPQSCGIGGDGFMLIHKGRGAPVALDGSGAVPAALTPRVLAARGLPNVPSRGAQTATAPGAVALLETALARGGTMRLADVVAPAKALAAGGFAVRPSLAEAARRAAETDAASDPVLGPLYWPGGAPVSEGDVIVNPALAGALDLIAASGSAALATGDLAQSIAATVAANDGFLSVDDLATHTTVEVAPLSVAFGDHVVWQLPEPTQGPAVIAALAEIGPVDVPDWDQVYQAVRTGMISARFDPAEVGGPISNAAKGDTTFIAVVDHDGAGASLITSVFGDFGSHLGVPALGGPIHNRATTFRIASYPLVPGKPPHTTIPGLVTTAHGDLAFVMGVAGGVMQPQAQVQLALRILVEGLEPQAALDAPRFKICFGGELALEPGHPLLAAYPEAADKDPGPEGFGAAQVVGWHNGELSAGADRRRGGSAIVVA